MDASNTQDKRSQGGFNDDFRVLLDGLRRQGSDVAKEEFTAEGRPPGLTEFSLEVGSLNKKKGPPGLRFHEAEDAGDAKYVKQWEQAIDNLLRSDLGKDLDLGSQVTKFNSPPQADDADLITIDKHSRVISERYLNDDGSTQASVQALDESIVKTFQTESGNKVTLRAHVQVERIEEPKDSIEAPESGESESDDGSASTVQDLHKYDAHPKLTSDAESSDEESSSVGMGELDKLMDHIKQLENHLDPSQAVLSQVLASSVRHSHKDHRKQGILFSILVFVLGLLAGMIIIGLYTRFSMPASADKEAKDAL